MKVKIQSNAAEMHKKLDNLVRKQFSFAATRATTKTAVEVRNRYVLPEYRKQFAVRNKNFGRIVHTVKAADLKHTRRTGVAVAAIKRWDSPSVTGTTKRNEPRIGKRPKSTEFMDRHVTGGQKTGTRGKKIAIPLTNSPITYGMGGKISKSFQPEQVIKSGRGFVFKGRGGKSFIGRMTSGELDVLYTLAQSTKIDKRYNPLPAARRGFAARFPRKFRESFIQALKTAKLR